MQTPSVGYFRLNGCPDAKFDGGNYYFNHAYSACGLPQDVVTAKYRTDSGHEILGFLKEKFWFSISSRTKWNPGLTALNLVVRSWYE